MAGRSRRQVCRASSGATADFYFTDFAPWKHLYRTFPKADTGHGTVPREILNFICVPLKFSV